jgi:hypothetical protein
MAACQRRPGPIQAGLAARWFALSGTPPRE